MSIRGTMEISAQTRKAAPGAHRSGHDGVQERSDRGKGDLAEAEVVLRKRGIASAGKKSSRTTKQGVIGTYIHPGAQLGVLIEVNCESDFVARTDDFQELVHDLAMQIAAADPQFHPQGRRDRQRRSKRSGKSSAARAHGRGQAGEDGRQDRGRAA